jgi:polar amino acid transport system substrate-binding protein
MKPIRIAALTAVMLIATAAAAQDKESALKQLTPTGTLRVAIAVGPAPSALWTITDPATGQYRGVPVDLGRALAEKLGVPATFIAHRASGEIQSSANAGTWDVSFMPVDEARKAFVDFGAPYHVLQSTYLIAAGSSVRSLAEANAAGVRIAGVKDTATFRASQAASSQATHISVDKPDDAIAMMREGKIDAIALSRETITTLAGQFPGSRVLDGGFLNSTTAVAVPKGRPEALAYVTAFVEDAKAAGLVRRAFDAIGLTSSVVAPAGMKP